MKLGFRFRIVVGCFAVLAGAVCALQTESQGATRGKDYESKSREELQKLCESGDAKGCLFLGNKLYSQQDYVGALTPLQKACDARNTAACNNLAIIYSENRKGVARDYAKAAQLYQRACDIGADGCGNLASMYQSGEGVAKDEVKAVQLYKKCCKTGRSYESYCCDRAKAAASKPSPGLTAAQPTPVSSQAVGNSVLPKPAKAENQTELAMDYRSLELKVGSVAVLNEIVSQQLGTLRVAPSKGNRLVAVTLRGNVPGAMSLKIATRDFAARFDHLEKNAVGVEQNGIWIVSGSLDGQQSMASGVTFKVERAQPISIKVAFDLPKTTERFDVVCNGRTVGVVTVGASSPAP